MESLNKLRQSRYFWQGALLALGALALAVYWTNHGPGGATAASIIAAIGSFLGGLVVAIGIDGAPPSLLDALRDAIGGRVPQRPAQVEAQLGRLWDDLGDVALKVQRAAQVEEQARERESELRRTIDRLDEEASRLRAELEDARRGGGDRGEAAELRRRLEGVESSRAEAERRAREAERDRDEIDRKLREAQAEVEKLQRRVQEYRMHVQDAERLISDHVDKLSAGFGEQMAAVEQTITSMQEISAALHQIAQHVEALASNAEESSSSILEMTATNDEVAENMANLANSVRETVSSIEEMTYSIKEVARNVDALSLTAEETSSSMNEMDVSIDQVQSNANETARLSEEVAVDAERGAEAILKTIDEINRIKETSS
ncbi:MAG TPA: chemotaxis protein, partial [Sandaracinaceae bacterium]